VAASPEDKRVGYVYLHAMGSVTQTWDRITFDLFMANPPAY
jgi:hypothetical protein